MPDSTHRIPPAGWVPQHDVDDTIIYYSGLEVNFPGVQIASEWTPEYGLRVTDTNGHVIPLDQLPVIAEQISQLHARITAASEVTE